jgi:hypothetical protein
MLKAAMTAVEMILVFIGCFGVTPVGAQEDE